MTKLKQEQDKGTVNYSIQHTEDKSRCFECNENVSPMTVIGDSGAMRLVELCDDCLPVVVRELWPEMTEEEYAAVVGQLKEV